MCETHETYSAVTWCANKESSINETYIFFQAEEEVTLTHFAYDSWKGDEACDVPSKTHGLLDLVEHAAAHKIEASLPGPIAVHCK